MAEHPGKDKTQFIYRLAFSNLHKSNAVQRAGANGLDV
jgi:hypothetical protein